MKRKIRSKKISTIHFSDDLERDVAAILDSMSIGYVHESQGARLDFYLPDHDVYIEIKQFHADRANKQLSENDNVILIQGRKSLAFLKFLFTAEINKP